VIGMLEFNDAGEVVYFRDNELVSSGLSEGHIGFSDAFEYFDYNGSIWRAPIACPIRLDVPIRNGARCECPDFGWNRKFLLSSVDWERCNADIPAI